MKPWFKLVLILTVVVSFAVCLYLGRKVFLEWKNRQMVKGASVTKLPKETFFKNSLSALEYLYEPYPNITIYDSAPWLEHPVSYKINSDTLNSIREYPVRKPDTGFRIIALGDSYTFGDHVNTAQSWPSQLERMLVSAEDCKDKMSLEVINLGVNGFDIQSEVERYKLHGDKYAADLVVWLLVDNDFTEIRELVQKRANQIYDDMKQHNTLDINNPWYTPLEMATEEFQATHTQEEIYAMQQSFMDDFNRTYAGKLLFVSLPGLNQRFENMIRTWAQKRKYAQYIRDLPDINNSPELHLLDYHPSELGHQKIAERIYTWLRNQKIIPCLK